MKTCKRLMNYIQIINAEGDVRACGWNHDNIIGNLQKQDFVEILNSDEAKKIRRMIAEGDYSNCPADKCPFLANNMMADILVDYDENEIIQYPEELYLAFEGNCNYNCSCCSSYKHMEDTRRNDYSEMYGNLEDKILPILPHVKCIGANGRGELFASKHIMKLLSEWNPLHAKEELSVSLETNGSLFNEKNWKKIKNLGDYNLSVSVTVMSFDEYTYQYLSGTELPISNIINNLNYIKKLRMDGIINELEIATVMQTLNFREMPAFIKRCIEEFGADIVRIRAISPGGPLDKDYQWFADVRNPEHPYYNIYRKTIKDSIFKNKKVQLWSADKDSLRGIIPSKKVSEAYKAANCLLRNSDLIKNLATNFGDAIAIYGIGVLGKTLVEALPKNKIKCLIDSDKMKSSFKGMRISSLNESNLYGIDTVFVTSYSEFDSIRKKLYDLNFYGSVVNLYVEISKWMECFM